MVMVHQTGRSRHTGMTADSNKGGQAYDGSWFTSFPKLHERLPITQSANSKWTSLEAHSPNCHPIMD